MGGRRRNESLDNGLQQETEGRIRIFESKMKSRGFLRIAWGQYKQSNPFINTWRYYNRMLPRWVRSMIIFAAILMNWNMIRLTRIIGFSEISIMLSMIFSIAILYGFTLF
jgi:hypothetical protein